MRILFVFWLFLLMFAPFSARAAVECQAKAPPRINVHPSKSRIKYDFTKGRDYLNRVEVDTISPYGANHSTNVSGLMSGSIQLKSNVTFMQETYPHQGRGCLFIKGVDVEIIQDPTIYIAKELPQGGCMHNVVLTHEYKHVDADRKIINKYTNLIGRQLERVIADRGANFGFIKMIRMNEVQNDVKEELHNVVRRMNDEMNAERRQVQQDIDSIEEYQSIAKRCGTEIRKNNAEIRKKLDAIIK